MGLYHKALAVGQHSVRFIRGTARSKVAILTGAGIVPLVAILSLRLLFASSDVTGAGNDLLAASSVIASLSSDLMNIAVGMIAGSTIVFRTESVPPTKLKYVLFLTSVVISMMSFYSGILFRTEIAENISNKSIKLNDIDLWLTVQSLLLMIGSVIFFMLTAAHYLIDNKEANP